MSTSSTSPPLTFGTITFVPAIHQRMAFADQVRRAALETTYDAIAAELPPALETWLVRGVLRLPQISAVCYPAGGDEATGEMFYVPIDPSDAMIEAARIALENEIDLHLIDGGYDPREHQPGPHEYDLPDDLMVESVGLERYADTVLPFLISEEPTLVSQREDWMARALASLSAGGRRVLCALGMGHLRGVTQRLREIQESRGEGGPEPAYPKPLTTSVAAAFLSHLKPESLPETLREIPYLAFLRQADRDGWEFEKAWRFDKMDALVQAYQLAGRRFTEKYGDTISLPRFRAMIQFARNQALVAGRLQPDTYMAVIAAKSTVDGDYGYEVYQTLRSFPSQERESDLPELKIRRGRGMFSDRDRKFRMRCSSPTPQTERINIGLRRRPTEEQIRFWKENMSWDGRLGLCSWPPEDERQERFMTFLRQRALQVLTDDKKQVIEFSTSFLDGLDIRETMRNWHTGKLYVQSKPQPRGQVGAVVVVFDEEPLGGHRYDWRCTLYAENQNESDISFYATPLGQNIVGPRISRTEFGGILSVYPANHIPDIWMFPGVEQLGTCGEALLAGGIVFSDERYVAYIAPRPPSAVMRELAARHNRQIIHIPIRQFSESRMKKIRRFHILNGKDVRNFAADYIFE